MAINFAQIHKVI